MDTAKLIEKLGGGTAIAEALSDETAGQVNRDSVYKWQYNGVPWRWRPAVVKLAEEKGVTLPKNFLSGAA